MKQLGSEVEISADRRRVWDVLIDFRKYEQWNPFIYKIVGEAREGSKIEIYLETPGGKTRKYQPTVTKISDQRELRWRGKSLFLDAEHMFVIEELGPERVRFVQREIFEGLLSSFFGQKTHSDIIAGFEAMNIALKERAERFAN